MHSRSTWVAALLFCSVAGTGTRIGAQQSPAEPPSFRSGVELVTVEVGVIDKDGRPVRGLASGDFKVTVAGEQRRVVTAEFIDTAAPRAGADLPDMAPVSTNEGHGIGRQFMFVVDNNSFDLGDARHVARAASRFFSELTFTDRSALVSLPVGTGVPFTWSHQRVQEALLRAGTAAGTTSSGWEYGSITEARDIATRGSFALRDIAARECATSVLAGGVGAGSTPSTGAPAGGGGGDSPSSGGGGSSGGTGGSGGSSGGQRPAPVSPAGDFATDRCSREIQSRAEMAWAMANANSQVSLSSLRQLFATLARIPGDKSVVLISGGWPLEESDQASLVRSLATEASAARVTVFTVFVPRSAASVSRRMVSTTAMSDQSLHLWPLETLANMTGGRAFRAEAGAEGIFTRLARELGAYYRIGVERNAGDAADQAKRLKVQVSKGGVMVRAREFFDVKTYEDRDWAARLASALESPVPATAVGLRVTSYLSADPQNPSTIRLVLAGDASRMQPGDAQLQVLVRDLEGRRVVAGEHRLPAARGSDVSFATNIPVAPGSYIVRLAVQDAAGRVGSVDHRVDARPASFDGVSVIGPLFVLMSASASEPHFALEGVRADERLALEVGLEGESARLESADVSFEIAASADGPALIEQPALLSRSDQKTFVLAQAVADVRVLPPGKYLARVKVRSANELLGEVRRGFTVLSRPTPVTAAEAASGMAATTRTSLPVASIRGRAAAATPRFMLDGVLAPHVLGAYLEKVAARPDAASPAVGDLLARARSSNIVELSVSDAHAAQTPIAAFLKGLTLLAQRKYDPAGNAFRSAMRASPDFYPAMVYLGACYAAVGNDKEASAIWRTALIKEGGTPTVHVLLADSLLRQGNGSLALQVVNAARRRWPEDADLNRRFVLAALGGGDAAAGLQALDELVKRGEADEPSLALGLLVLYESIAGGRAIESADRDRARMLSLAETYRLRGGPSLPLVETWVAAVRQP